MLGGEKAAKELSANRSSGLNVERVTAAWSGVRSAATPSWLVAVMDSAVKDSVMVKAHGEGGFKDVVAALAPADVGYCAVPCSVDGAAKHFFLCVVGPEVPAMKKARVSLQKSAVYNAFDGVVAEVTVMDAADCTPDFAQAALTKALAGRCVKVM